MTTNTLVVKTELLGADESVDMIVVATFPGLENVDTATSFAALPKVSQEHIIRVGLTNILRDSMAGKASDPVEARQALVDKLQRVIKGDVSGAARGPRKSQEERVRDDYLMELITGAAKRQGKALPKGKEALSALREGVYAKNQAKIDAEVKRRLKAAAGDLEIEL